MNVKTRSGGVYEGTVAEITNDYVALAMKNDDDSRDIVFVMLQSIESILPRGTPQT
ncbi:MAG: hypothetical protein ICV68_00890 [Pyrinomonadaceae bacterium]|nr:hypothetical protein [Pyrinomonadaceae bacterium]